VEKGTSSKEIKGGEKAKTVIIFREKRSESRMDVNREEDIVLPNKPASRVKTNFKKLGKSGVSPGFRKRGQAKAKALP